MDNIFALKPKIEDYLQIILSRKSVDPWQVDVFGRLKKFVSGGKFIRGCLAAYICQNLGHDKALDPIPLAAAIELIQAGFLIHDDIMDQDELRRGHPSIHAQYKELGDARGYRNSRHTSESLAVCAGDAAIFLAYEHIAGLNLKAKPHAKLLKYVSTQWQRTCWGQMQDIALAARNASATPKEILDMYREKTVRYTFCVPLVSAAIICRQPGSVVEHLDKLGENMGLLFQLHDDELDLYGIEKITGKPVGSDTREHKQTYWNAKNFDKAEIYAYMDNLEKAAVESVSSLPINTSAQQALIGLVKFVRNRNK